MPLTKEQDELRKQGVGASDVPALLGLSDWGGPAALYARLTGDNPEPSVSNPATERGDELEEPVANWVAKKYGVELVRGGTAFHPHWRYELATPDRLVALSGMPVECKTAAGSMAHEWGEEQTDNVPLRYLAQVQWQLWVLQRTEAWLAVLVGGHRFEFRRYVIQADKELQEMMHEVVTRFYTKHVLPRVPPPPDGTDSYTKWLTRKYPQSTDVWLAGSPETDAHAMRYGELKRQFEELEVKLEAEKNYLKAAIGDAAGIKSTLYNITWKATKPISRVDLEALETAHPDLVARYRREVAHSRPFRFILKAP